MFMAMPVPWLHGIAKGTIKTKWGEMMKAENPLEEMDKLAETLRADKKNSFKGVTEYLNLAPLLAERLAIAEYKLKNPMIEAAAPEVLSYQEVLEMAMRDCPTMQEEDLKTLLRLLKEDDMMKPLQPQSQTNG